MVELICEFHNKKNGKAAYVQRYNGDYKIDYYYETDRYLKSITFPSSPLIPVLRIAVEYTELEDRKIDPIDNLFNPVEDTQIDY